MYTLKFYLQINLYQLIDSFIYLNRLFYNKNHIDDLSTIINCSFVFLCFFLKKKNAIDSKN